MSMDHVMKEIYTNAIHAVVPANLIRSQVNYCPANETLEVSGKTFILKRFVLFQNHEIVNYSAFKVEMSH